MRWVAVEHKIRLAHKMVVVEGVNNNRLFAISPYTPEKYSVECKRLLLPNRPNLVVP